MSLLSSKKTNTNKLTSSKVEFDSLFFEEMSAWKNYFKFVWSLGNCKKCESDSKNVFHTLCCIKFKKMQMIKVFWKETNGRQKAVSSIIARPISCIKKINNHITWKNLFQGLQLGGIQVLRHHVFDFFRPTHPPL